MLALKITLKINVTFQISAIKSSPQETVAHDKTAVLKVLYWGIMPSANIFMAHTWFIVWLNSCPSVRMD